MEPPCEHGGVLHSKVTYAARLRQELQWSRRVNTAECEHGTALAEGIQLLQWSRRVNTAEWQQERSRATA